MPKIRYNQGMKKMITSNSQYDSSCVKDCALAGLLSLVISIGNVHAAQATSDNAVNSTGRIYQSTDTNGNVVFSDTPSQGATQVTLPRGMTFAPAYTIPVPSNITAPQNRPITNKQSSTIPLIELLLLSPNEGATLRNTQGNIPVAWAVKTSPEYDRNQAITYQIFINNDMVKQTTETNVILNDVERGEHKIYLTATNQSGKQIAVSSTHTIFVHQNSQLFR